MARHTLSSVHAGLHLLVRMSRQISPVLKWMFGWHTFVTMRTCGGTIGYDAVMMILSLNTPPWYGESGGPFTNASHSNMLPLDATCSATSLWGFLCTSYWINRDTSVLKHGGEREPASLALSSLSRRRDAGDVMTGRTSQRKLPGSYQLKRFFFFSSAGAHQLSISTAHRHAAQGQTYLPWHLLCTLFAHQ